MSFVAQLDALIESKHLLKHEFYQAWSKGELSLECLQDYAAQYYNHVQAFPRYISAVHSRTEDASARRLLLNNLIEEEAGSPNHPDLWRQFAQALGVADNAVSENRPNAEMASLVSTFQRICGQGSTAEGVAALYAYESQIPPICISKIDGLKTHYGMQDAKGWEYFRVHIAADEAHAAEERGLLETYVNADNFAAVRKAVNDALDALWNFLSGLCHKYGVVC